MSTIDVLPNKRLVWYTHGLWSKAQALGPFEVELSSIREIDQDCMRKSVAARSRD